MAKNKTNETKLSVSTYLKKITNEKRRKDCESIIDIMSKSTGFEPKMWGTSIVGFGSCHYQYESGHEGDMPLAGMSSRANAIVLYLETDPKTKDAQLEKLGKHKTGKACIYVQKLEDIDTGVLGQLSKQSVLLTQKRFPKTLK